MIAPIAHLVGHTRSLWLSPGSFAIPYTLFLLAQVAFDYLAEKRVRFLTTTMAIGLFAYQVLQAVVIGPSSEWHRFAEWVSQQSTRRRRSAGSSRNVGDLAQQPDRGVSLGF